MRTTLQIDDDVLQAARTLAAARHQSVGKVLSDLARRGLKPSRDGRYKGSVPVFHVSEDAPLFGLDEVREALDET